MKMKVKVLIGILIVLVIVFGLLMFRYVYNPSYDKSVVMTKEDIQMVLDKRLDVKNIYVKSVREDKLGAVDNPVVYSEFFVKGNMAKVIEMTENGKRKIYQEDKNSGEGIWIFETKGTVAKFKNQMSAFDLIKGYDYLDLEKDVFASDTYIKLVYLGKTKIDDRNVIAVLLERNDRVKELLYIDEETGFILKHITKSIFTNYTTETQIKVGSVTDDDVRFIDYEKDYPDFKVVDM